MGKGKRGAAPLQPPEKEVSELAELRQLVETLCGSVRARDDFIAIAAHELRNPMTPIVGVAELALIAARKDEGKCPPRVIILLELLQRLVQDYVRRATKLLDVSRLETRSRDLLFPKVTDAEAPPIRPERHIPNSIATMRRRLIVALARTLPKRGRSLGGDYLP